MDNIAGEDDASGDFSNLEQRRLHSNASSSSPPSSSSSFNAEKLTNRIIRFEDDDDDDDEDIDEHNHLHRRGETQSNELKKSQLLLPLRVISKPIPARLKIKPSQTDND